MSLLSKILGAMEDEGVDEDAVKRIVQAVGVTPDKVDLAGLRVDLAGLMARREFSLNSSSSRSLPPTERKRHAKSVRGHAKNLLSDLRLLSRTTIALSSGFC